MIVSKTGNGRTKNERNITQGDMKTLHNCYCNNHDNIFAKNRNSMMVNTIKQMKKS